MVLLILISPLYLDQCIVNLHSTMVLLIRKRKRPRSSDCVNIYIPLWFYLYWTQMILWGKPSIIYIPLWFYLYRSCPVFSAEALKFTFHYGSTYTDGSYTRPQYFANLHSTMVLLIPLTFCPPWFTIKNLHSTMVLLIRITFFNSS